MTKKRALLSDITIRRAPSQGVGADQVTTAPDLATAPVVVDGDTKDRNARKSALVGLLTILLLSVAGGTLWWTFAANTPTAAPELGEPIAHSTSGEIAELLKTDVLPISKMEAEAINAARSDDVATLVSARPFLLPLAAKGGNPAGSDAVRCLTQAIYYEAASESDAGQRAVAQVVLNRMRHAAFPKSVCGVVYQGWERATGCQFSFTCDGSLARQPSAFGWARAHRVATAALAGWVEPSVGLATHYHANYVVPYWASSLDKAKTIGAHLFYVMRGGNNRLAAFAGRYDPSTEALPGAQVADVALLSVEGLEILDDAIALPKIPSNRTEVREDGLGTLVEPSGQKQTKILKPVMAPRADDNSGTLDADQRVGTLTPR